MPMTFSSRTFRQATARARLVVVLSSAIVGCGGGEVTTQTFTPSLARLAILRPTPNFGGMTIGTSFRFAVQGFDQTGAPMTDLPPVSWTSSDTAVATVDSSGLSVGKRAGQVVITATVHSGSTTVSDTL